MEVQQNVLYVMTQGAYLHRDHLALQVQVEKQVRLAVPIHNVQAVALFGNVMVSPAAMQLCAENSTSITFLSESGRMMARVDAPVSGNVLLRREQFRQADQPERSLAHARCIVAGKLQNCRANLLRSARDHSAPDDQEALRRAARDIAAGQRRLPQCQTTDEVRGTEGNAARTYFGVFGKMIRQDRDSFALQGRSRRPPLDRGNALLSYLYALLLNDCIGALVAAGLDPNVGYLHTDRPGRPSLALDLMEEFRPLLADRMALTLINRRQVTPGDFTVREGGAVEISETARRGIVAAWQERKQDQTTHLLLGQTVRVGLLPHLQARVLARTIRGDLGSYLPCRLK